MLIGDTIQDYEVSLEIGADCILIANGHQSKSKLQMCRAQVLDSLEEVNSYV
ncbi:MAG: hypothetical protein M1480_04030 [Bacteroidetes bacterium]|nr:hypothetical protein [Bacteroidota bacterium]